MPSSRSPIGRDGELLELAEFFASDTRPAAMLLVGPEGMGKSTLWEASLADARERSHLVLEARPVEAETGLSFSVLSDLLAPILDSVLPDLPEPQRNALEAALLLRPSNEALDPRAIGSAALSALRAAAAARRVVIAIDNIQWLDPASAATLSFALRRLRDEDIGGLFAARGNVDDRIVRTWSGLMPTRVMAVGPLSLGATHALVFDRLGAVMPRPLLHRLHDLSRGNPYYTLELTRAWQAGSFHLAEAEALPPALADLLGSRIASLPARTRHVLALASQMSRPTLTTLDSAVGGDAAERLDRGVAARVVEIDGNDVRFTHPLLAASAYAAIPTAERRHIHSLLATVVGDGEERARHLGLAASGPDESIATIVELAAEAAFRRGAPSSSAALMSEAARLTPPDAFEDHRRRVLAEAEFRFETGETDRAELLVGPLIAESAPGPDRARLIARQARFRHFGEDISGSVELLRAALAEAGDDPGLLIEIEEGLVWGLLLIRSDVEGAAAHARSAVATAERLGDDAALAEALAALAMAEALLGIDWRPTMRRALDLEPATLRLRVLRHPSFAYGYLLSVADELDLARTVFTDLRTRAAEHGDDSALAPILGHLSVIECLASHFGLAEALADEAREVALQSGQVPSQIAALGRKALAAAMRGDLARSRDVAAAALALAVGDDFDPATPQPAAARGGEFAIWAIGHAALSAGDHAAADRHLGPLCAFLLAADIREPGEIRPLGDEIEALANLGRLGEAGALVAQLVAMSDRVQRPSVSGTAERSQAIVLAATGEVSVALRHAEKAVEHHRAAAMPLELARSLLVLGATQRRSRQKRAAREALEESLAILDRIGASAWALIATAELGRVGGRQGPSSELTPAERRAAELVANGHTNKEIASLMYVSPKTVEANLSRVYAKLGVGSRTELVRHLADGPSKT